MVTRRDVWVGMLLYPRHTLPTAAAPVVVAVGLAARVHRVVATAALAAFLVGWLVQLGGVFTDNYQNLSKHPDDLEHADFVEGVRGGVVTMAEIRFAIYAVYALALLTGAYLAWTAGPTVLVIGVAAIVASLAYSSGPFPLGDHALGEPLFFAFFGVVSVVGSYFVQVGSFPVDAFVAGLPVAALTTNILVIDNIRDLDYDRSKGERTIAVAIGPRWSRVEYCALLAFAYVVPVWFWAARGLGAAMLLPCLSAPYALVVARRVLRARTHEEMIPLTPQAGQVLLAHSILFAVGLAT